MGSVRWSCQLIFRGNHDLHIFGLRGKSQCHTSNLRNAHPARVDPPWPQCGEKDRANALTLAGIATFGGFTRVPRNSTLNAQCPTHDCPTKETVRLYNLQKA